ncbi:MAG: membrane protein [Saprospiraceae bacterium]|nr:MAG: membrane protein [Saprospiraceae bacterium]
MSSVWRSIALCALICFGASGVFGQESNFTIRPKINSPLSRFGLGDGIDQFFAASSGMGGLSAAYNDGFHLNILNPASFAFLEATAFDVGLYGKYTSLESNSQSDSYWSGNLKYLALGFPLKNSINQALDRIQSPWKFGMGFSLVPYTTVGYDIAVTTIDPDPAIDTLSNFLKGNGGTYRIYWTNAARYKGLSIGLNLGYQFGKITNSRLVNFDDVEQAYSTEFLDDISIRGLVWNLGLQYRYNFKKLNDKGEKIPSGERITVGVYGNSDTRFNTNSNSYYHRDYFSYPGGGFNIDTILYQEGADLKGVLPAEVTFGIAYEKVNKFRLGADFSTNLWSHYENDIKKEALKDSWRFAFGGEYIPNIISYNHYYEKIRYRAGFFYGTDPRSLRDTQLSKYGITFGLGLPIIMPRQQTSFVDLSFEIGKQGAKDVLQETYVQMTVGFTLNDNSWFFKRKFN